MTRTQSWYGTSVGKKLVVGVTGVILFLYLIAHLLGNLQIFAGRDAINAYASLLHAREELLWVARLVLLAAVGLHILASVQLWWQNRQARPESYRKLKYEKASYVSRTMIWSGPIVGAFVLYHVLHLTTQTVGPTFDQHDIYSGVVAGFQVWYISVFYIVAVTLVGIHMYHGAWSFFQTLGLSHPKYNHWRRIFATALAVFIAVGNIAIPVSVLTGIVS